MQFRGLGHYPWLTNIVLAKTKPQKLGLVSGPNVEIFAISCLSRPRWASHTCVIRLSMLKVWFQYSTNFKRGNDCITQKVNYVGNNNKSLHISVEASLKRLPTSYIDLLYVHWWDFETSIEEVMRSLHTLIVARKVLYLVSFVINI
jgi:hypothetical protein